MVVRIRRWQRNRNSLYPDKNRGTICVSSQVGCSLSCSFCHTGTMKFSRNLSTSEILGQVMYVKNILKDWNNKSDKKIIT